MPNPEDSASAARNEPKRPRFPQLTMGELNEQQRALAEKMMKVTSAGMGGPVNLFLRSPEMATRRSHFMRYLRFETSVPLPLNELAVLIQARLANAQYEFWAHYRHALKAGLPPAVADALKNGQRPTAMSAEEGAVYQFCVELSLEHRVSDATFDALRKLFSEQQIVDLIVISGEYSCVAMLLNAAEVEIPNRESEPLKPMSYAELCAGLLPMASKKSA